MSSRFSRPVDSWSTATVCIANPTRRRTSAGRDPTSSPATVARPPVGASRVARIRIVVVLPAPLGPRNPKNSPAPTEKSMLSTATVPPG